MAIILEIVGAIVAVIVIAAGVYHIWGKPQAKAERSRK